MMAKKKRIGVTLNGVEAGEVLARKATKFGTGAHVILPGKHLGKKVIVIIVDD